MHCVYIELRVCLPLFNNQHPSEVRINELPTAAAYSELETEASLKLLELFLGCEAHTYSTNIAVRDSNTSQWVGGR